MVYYPSQLDYIHTKKDKIQIDKINQKSLAFEISHCRKNISVIL